MRKTAGSKGSSAAAPATADSARRMAVFSNPRGEAPGTSPGDTADAKFDGAHQPPAQISGFHLVRDQFQPDPARQRDEGIPIPAPDMVGWHVEAAQAAFAELHSRPVRDGQNYQTTRLCHMFNGKDDFYNARHVLDALKCAGRVKTWLVAPAGRKGEHAGQAGINPEPAERADRVRGVIRRDDLLRRADGVAQQHLNESPVTRAQFQNAPGRGTEAQRPQKMNCTVVFPAMPWVAGDAVGEVVKLRIACHIGNWKRKAAVRALK
jgi:hypothetical protein